MSNEEILAGNAAIKYIELKDAIIKKAIAQATVNKITENATKILDLQLEKEKLLDELREKAGDGSAVVMMEETGRISRLGRIAVKTAEINRLQEINNKLVAGVDTSSLLYEEKKDGKPKKEKDDSLAILKDQQKARLAVLEQNQQELLRNEKLSNDQRIQAERDNEKEIVELKKRFISEQLDLVEYGSKEYYAIWAEWQELEKDEATNLTEFLISEEKRRNKELEKQSKEALENEISDIYDAANK